MLPGKKWTPVVIGRILIRRRWWLVLPFAIGLATAPLIARHVPTLYRSETLIQVIPQRVPDSYVKSTVTAGVEDRLPSISDHIVSRSRLERLILEFNLYEAERRQGVMEDVVRRMRADITLPPLETNPTKRQETFRVSYVNQDPQIAQKVTARLASLYIEENLRDRGNLADSTSAFLESQLEEAKQRLIDHEQKLEEYRRRNAGELPTQLESNLQVIQNAELQLQAATEAANRARERRLLFERQLADAEIAPAAAASVAAPGAPESIALTPAQQLQAAEARLEQLKQRYTSDYPDVRAQEGVVRELRARAAEEARTTSADKPKPVVTSPADVARQNRIKDLRAEIEVIDHQLASFATEEARLRQKIREYQAKVDVVPTRESELVELTRDYSTLQAQYQSLATKREDSKLAANLERRQIGEQFRIIDPASLPARPFNQRDRLIFIFAGAIIGLVIGVGAAGVLELSDSSFHEEADVLSALKLPVLTVVPVLATDRERRSRRLRRLAIDCAGVLVLVGCAAVLAIWRLQL
jgi:polysaccharide chain length determinant protein (PEP-CTERM system associated)